MVFSEVWAVAVPIAVMTMSACYSVTRVCFDSRSGALESGPAAGEERTLRRGRFALPTMLEAEWRRSQRPSHSRGHQNIRTSTSWSLVRRSGSSAPSRRHVSGGCGQDAWTLSTAGINTVSQLTLSIMPDGYLGRCRGKSPQLLACRTITLQRSGQ